MCPGVVSLTAFCYFMAAVNELVQKVKERTSQKKTKVVPETQVKILKFLVKGVWANEPSTEKRNKLNDLNSDN